jgi:hypothetical protein
MICAARNTARSAYSNVRFFQRKYYISNTNNMLSRRSAFGFILPGISFVENSFFPAELSTELRHLFYGGFFTPVDN